MAGGLTSAPPVSVVTASEQPSLSAARFGRKVTGGSATAMADNASLDEHDMRLTGRTATESADDASPGSHRASAAANLRQIASTCIVLKSGRKGPL